MREPAGSTTLGASEAKLALLVTSIAAVGSVVRYARARAAARAHARAAEERVDERRLAYIGSPDDSDFDPLAFNRGRIGRWRNT